MTPTTAPPPIDAMLLAESIVELVQEKSLWEVRVRGCVFETFGSRAMAETVVSSLRAVVARAIPAIQASLPSPAADARCPSCGGVLGKCEVSGVWQCVPCDYTSPAADAERGRFSREWEDAAAQTIDRLAKDRDAMRETLRAAQDNINALEESYYQKSAQIEAMRRVVEAARAVVDAPVLSEAAERAMNELDAALAALPQPTPPTQATKGAQV